MSLLVTLNGSNYIIPETNEVGWGSNLDDYFVAIAAGVLQKTGGSFTLSAETDFGASYGLKSLYYKSRASNVAATGAIRLANAETGVVWRNFLNNADLALTVNASNQLTFNGTPIESNALTSAHILVGNASNIATDVAVTGDISIDNTGLTAIGAGKIVNAQVNASAAIAYSKLALTGSILNADINSAAAIAYSKLNLSGSILNADINASAAIAMSKLAALGTAKALQSNAATGAIEVSSVTNTELGYLSGVTSALQTQLGLKAPLANPTFTGTVVIPTPFTLGATSVTATGTEMNYLVGVTSAIQTQIAAKMPLAGGTFSGDVTFASNKGIFFTDNTSNTVKITAPTAVTTYTMKWPIAQGGSNQYLTNDGSGNLSWTNAAGTGTVNSGTQYQLAYYATTTNTVSGLTLITASRALASDANGLPVAATTTATELGYVNGVTSAIQTQMDLKAPKANPTFTGTVVIPTPFTIGAVSMTATGTELNYVVGVTSAIQTQLGTKAPLASPALTGTPTITAGTGDGTSFNILNLIGGGTTATKGSTFIDSRTTASVTTSSVNILDFNGHGALVLVLGDSGGTVRFTDLVLCTSSTTTPLVIASIANIGSPTARTYSATSFQLKLAMASGTYNIHAASISVNTPT